MRFSFKVLEALKPLEPPPKLFLKCFHLLQEKLLQDVRTLVERGIGGIVVATIVKDLADVSVKFMQLGVNFLGQVLVNRGEVWIKEQRESDFSFFFLYKEGQNLTFLFFSRDISKKGFL